MFVNIAIEIQERLDTAKKRGRSQKNRGRSCL